MDLQKKRLEAKPKFLIVMCIYGIFAAITVLRRIWLDFNQVKFD